MEGMPPGWKCVEKMYQSGANAGKTYIRFANGKHSNVLSLKAAIQLHAQDLGQDPAEAVRLYEKKKEERKEELAKLREERGHLKGEKRQEAIDHFRGIHGKLDGATVVQLPGWKGESRVLENCGQISATYYDPEGRVFKLVNDIEAFFGTKMMQGEAIPDIAEARSKILYDEKGKPVNVARRGDNIEDVEAQVKKRKLLQQEVGIHLYQEAPGFSVVQVHGKGEKAPQGDESVRQVAAEIQKCLLGRGFQEDIGLLAVVGKEPTNAVVTAVAGIYYKMSEVYNDRPCYQRVQQYPGKSGVLACRGQYIFWSTKRDSWKIGALDDGKIGYAFCPEDAPLPTAVEKPWSVLKHPAEAAS